MKKFILGLTLLCGMSLLASDVQAQYKTTYKSKPVWSHRKKDAVIGAGGGAVAGALLGHGAKGAVIGGVVGGGAGYLIGRHKDKKYPQDQNRRRVVYKSKRY